MGIRLLTPFAALFALTALILLAVFVLRWRRLRAIRAVLGLEQPSLRSQLSLAAAIAAVPLLLGVAAAQPVVETTRTVPERTDVQVFVVLDVSRSMLAAPAPGAPTRFERARGVALRLRNELPEVPFGVASLTDRVLPHLFPTTDGRVLAATLAQAVDIEQPPAGSFYATVATNLNALRSVPETNYFPPSAKKRVLVVLTDGETQPAEGELARAFKRRPRIQTVFIRFWDEDEQIYETGVAEGGYKPDSGSGPALARTASLVGGRVFEESDAGQAAAAVREAVGEGTTVDRRHESGRLALMPYLTLAALIPLGFVLLRRNLWWSRNAVFVAGPWAARNLGHLGRLREGARVGGPPTRRSAQLRGQASPPAGRGVAP
ncbi:MAG: VWA domain-containing protein [Actinobacteria bacterium]|nr:VWA domain-containing protein [Actinomycetota bacterium]